MSEYDHVVVGAGTAGCVVARRLADAGRSVLVLEAGDPDDDRKLSIPAASPDLFRSQYDWAYATATQSELDDRRLFWPRGKVLGGSSAINAQIYFRGHPRDYDAWVAAGNDGWGADDLQGCFERVEGVGEDPGQLPLEQLPHPNPLTESLLEAAAAEGFDRVGSFRGQVRPGFAVNTVSQRNGRRASAATAYLTPALDRSNLTARTGAQATRIQLDGGRARGVVYVADGQRRSVAASESVVVAAGAVNSPHLLMCSGIGPAAELTAHDIEVAVDLPGVGKNLQDHLLAGVSYECTSGVSLDGGDTLWNYLRYLVCKRGPLASNIVEASGFLHSAEAGDAPDLQVMFTPAYYLRHGFDNPPGNGYSVGVTVLSPDSRGRVGLRSADPLEPPVIDPGYLTAEADLDRLVEGLRHCADLALASPFDDVRGERIWPERVPESPADWRAYARRRAQTVYHPVGTCKMGTDEMAVVDDRLRVHGVTGLRVVDASVMPTIPRCNTNGPTFAVAERAATFLLEEA